jgi:hypothetical protein
MVAALENEKRDRQAEKKEMLVQTVLENERRDRETEKIMAALENEKRDRQAALENERRDCQAEKMVAALENEKRDRQAEKKEMVAAQEKKEMLMQIALENENERRGHQAEKKEVIAAQEKKEMLTVLENQKRDHQSQIDQLKWEARFSQMEQQLLAAQAQNIQPIDTGIPGQYTTNGTPQQQVELLRQHNQMLEPRMRENETQQLASTTPLVGALSVPQQSTLTPAALPSAALAPTALPSATKQ